MTRRSFERRNDDGFNLSQRKRRSKGGRSKRKEKRTKRRKRILGAAHWGRTGKNRAVGTGSFARPFARTAHSFVCPALLASLVRSAALIHSLARSFTPQLMGRCMIRCLKTTWFCPTVARIISSLQSGPIQGRPQITLLSTTD